MCIFYDILQKGRGVSNWNHILENIRNCDKNLGGVVENIQCHKCMAKKYTIHFATPLTHHHPPPLPLNPSQDIWVLWLI